MVGEKEKGQEGGEGGSLRKYCIYNYMLFLLFSMKEASLRKYCMYMSQVAYL